MATSPVRCQHCGALAAMSAAISGGLGVIAPVQVLGPAPVVWPHPRTGRMPRWLDHPDPVGGEQGGAEGQRPDEVRSLMAIRTRATPPSRNRMSAGASAGRQNTGEGHLARFGGCP